MHDSIIFKICISVRCTCCSTYSIYLFVVGHFCSIVCVLCAIYFDWVVKCSWLVVSCMQKATKCCSIGKEIIVAKGLRDDGCYFVLCYLLYIYIDNFFVCTACFLFRWTFDWWSWWKFLETLETNYLFHIIHPREQAQDTLL